MDKKYIAILGAAVLVVGLFLPALSSRTMSAGMLLSDDGVNWRGLVVLGCALLGAVLAFLGRVKHAVWPGLAALGFLVWQYLDVQARLGRMASIISGENVPPEFTAMLSERMPQLNLLGWGVMGAGALIMIVAGVMAWKGSPPPA